MRRFRVFPVIFIVVGAGVGTAHADERATTTMPPVVQNWRTFTTRDGLPHDSIRAIHVEGDRLWVGTDGGLAVREHGKWRTWKRLAANANEPLAPISAIDVDPETGDAWLGTWGGGVLRLTGGRFDRFDQINSGLAGDLVFDVLFTRGKVFVATNGGLSSYDPLTQKWALYLERRDGPSQTAVTTLGVDPAGTALNIGAWCGRLWRLDLDGRDLKPDAGPPGGLPIAGSADSKRRRGAATALAWGGGALWWASQDRVYRRSADGTWDARMIEAGLRQTDFVQCIAPGDAEELWLGTDQGLCALVDGASRTWVSYRLCDSPPQITTSVYREDRLIARLTSTQGFGHNRIRCIAVSGGEVWVGTPCGLARGSGRARCSGLETPTSSQPSPRGATPGATAEDVTMPPVGGDVVGLSKRTVPVGVLMPVNKTMPLPGRQVVSLSRVDLPAVQLAVEEANAQGGYRGALPFQLERDVHGYGRYGWYLPEDELITASEVSGVRGLVGSIGPSERIATACITRTETPVVNAAATPATVDEAVTPWIVRCPKDGRPRIEDLATYLFVESGFKRPAVLRIQGAGASPITDSFIRLAIEHGCPPVLDDVVAPAGEAPGSIIETLREARADCVVSFCKADEAAWIVRSLRNADLHLPFVGGPKIVRHDFGSLAGGKPGRVMALWGCPSVLTADGRSGLAARYQRRFKVSIGIGAFRDYEAMSHLLSAINLAGLDREAIRETLASMRAANVARLEDGRWRFGSPRP